MTITICFNELQEFALFEKLRDLERQGVLMSPEAFVAQILAANLADVIQRSNADEVRREQQKIRAAQQKIVELSRPQVIVEQVTPPVLTAEESLPIDA